MRAFLCLVLVCGYNLFFNKEESIIHRLLLPLAIAIAVVREWFVISLPNATTVPLRAELYNLANWFRAIALWTIVGGMRLYYRLTPERG